MYVHASLAANNLHIYEQTDKSESFFAAHAERCSKDNKIHFAVMPGIALLIFISGVTWVIFSSEMKIVSYNHEQNASF